MTPKSTHRTSPRWITPLLHSTPAVARSTSGWNQTVIPSSCTRCRSHHSTSSVLVSPGWITSLEKAAASRAWTVSWISR